MSFSVRWIRRTSDDLPVHAPSGQCLLSRRFSDSVRVATDVSSVS